MHPSSARRGASRVIVCVLAALLGGVVVAPAAWAAAPDAPAQPSVAASAGQITVSFTAPADGGSAITGYTAICTSSDGGATGSATDTGSPIVVTGLSNGKTYTCAVTATNADGDSVPSPDSAPAVPSRIPDAPPKPTVAADSGQISVTFSAPFNGGNAISSYTATCTSSNGGATGSDVDTGSPIIVGGLTNGKTYTCNVVATNANGDSAPSPDSNATVPSGVPSAPAQPSVAGADSQISVGFTAPFNGGSPITGYTAACSSSDGGVSGSNTDTTSPIVVTGLDNGKTYTCTVTATNTNGDGPASPLSTPVTPSTVPNAPGAPTVAGANAQIVVTFSAPPTGGSAITGYTASCTSSNGGTAGSNTGATSPIVVSSVTNGKSYTCTVVATNANGDSPPSAASSSVTPNRVPDAPAKPSVNPDDAQIAVTFAAPFNGGSPITGYTASCTSSNGGTAGSNTGATSPIVVSGLTNGKSYTCTVVATNANGDSPASPASVSTIPSRIPDAPAQPFVTAGNGQITVTFATPFDGGSAITNYTATCTSSNGGTAGSDAGNSSPSVVTGLSNGKTYTCTVVATNANGDSPASPASASTIPSRVPDAPPQPTVAAANAQILVTFSTPFNGGNAIISYTASCTSSNGGAVGSVTDTSSPIVVTGLSNGKSYTCTVVATNGIGDSPASVASAVAIPSRVPDAPAQPSVASGNGQITVSFVAPFNGGSTITNYAATCTSSDGGTTGTDNGTSSPSVVTGLSNGKTYTCSVVATNANGDSPSSPLSAPVVPSRVPDAPAQPSVVAANAQITVSFSAPFNGGSAITSYTATCTSSNGGTAGTNTAAVSPIVVGSLTNGKAYTCTVLATNANGSSAASAASVSVTPKTVPNAPAQPTVVPDDGQITVSFTAPSNGGSAITGYSATCTSSNGGTPGTDTAIGSPIVVSPLDNGKSYTCTVIATNANGNSAPSPASTTAVPSRAPDPPAQPTVSAGNAQITVTFSAPFNGGSTITSYTATCTSSNGGTPGTNSGGAPSIVVSGLTNAKSYTCTVFATNANGDGPASPPSVAGVPKTVPNAPTQPEVAADDGQITVAFTTPFNGGSAITGFTATCTSSNGGVARSVTGAGSPIVVSPLDNGKTYTCTVTASNVNGTGPASPASAPTIPNTIPDPPAQPTVAAGNTQLTVTFTAPFNGGSPITAYTASCTSSNGGTPGTNTGTASPILVTGLTNAKNYTCTVLATNADGDGPASPPSAVVVPKTVPNAPAKPTVTPGNAQITVTFTAPADGGSAITGYSVVCASSNGGATGSANGTSSPITVTGLTNGKSYTCTVGASNVNGPGPTSPPSNAATPSTTPSAPGQPTVAAADAQITVTFTAPADGGSAITGYTAACTSSNGGTAGNANAATSPIVVGGLTNGKTYSCTVVATNANGSSSASAASANAMPTTTPSTPAKPTVTAATAQITVAFSPPFDGGSPITGYTATCTSSNGGATGTKTGATSPITVTGLTNAKTYTCTVTATNGNGAGPTSSASNAATPSTIPSAPAKPTVAPGNGQIPVTFSAPFDGGSAITSYTATCTSSNGGATGTKTGATSPITVTGLTNAKTYTCTVTATNGNGAGPASPASNSVVPNFLPSAPGAPVATAKNAAITVAFTTPANGGSPIVNFTAACTSSNGGIFGTVSGASSPLTVPHLTNGKSYQCTVDATNGIGTGPNSPASHTVIPSTVPGATGKPTIVVGNTRLTVSFRAPPTGGSPITSYRVTCISTNGGAAGTATGLHSPLTVTGLTNTKSYGCSVVARNANGSGGRSAVVRAIPSSPLSASSTPHGFRLFAGDGGVFTFGDARNYGSAAGVARHLVVGMTATADNHGYWLVATDGGIFSFGNARFYGSTGAMTLNQPIVGMATTPTGNGYWLVASDGGIFSYGDARFFGSTGAIRLNQPIVGMATTPTGNGYWLVAADGGVFSFGDARFFGSPSGRTHSPVVGMATTRLGGGYWIAAADGSVYAFGDAPALGSASLKAGRLPVRGIAGTPTGKGYWLAAGDGGVFAFGDAPYIGWPGPLVLWSSIRGVSR